MSNGILPRPFCGIVPPMVTPLTSDEQLDTVGLKRLIEHLVSGGVHGVFVLGTTGEGLSLTHRLRREVIVHACEAVAGRIPVLVGVTDTSLQESIDLAEFAGTAGADGVVFAPPVYFPHEQAELLYGAMSIAESSPLPLMLYNIPVLTKIAFEPETVAKLCAVPNIIGIKDSSGDMDYFQAILECADIRRDWALFTGHDLLLSQTLPIGAHGGVCGGANVFPRLFVDIYNASRQDNYARVAELQSSIVQLTELYRVRGNSALGVIRGIKCALEEMGICSGGLVAPSRRLPDSSRDEVRAILNRVFEGLPAMSH